MTPTEVGRPLVLWSAPRCRSTMFERMMFERGDFTVVHEPLSRVHDFGGAEVLDRVCTSGPEVIEAVLRGTAGTRLFVKDTTDFRYPEVLSCPKFLTGAQHTFLIRDPREAIPSHVALNPHVTADEIGFAALREIHDAVTAATGAQPVVLDSAEVVAAPARTIHAYCAAVGIPYLASALTWQPGELPIWQRTGRWHAAVADSSGIQPRPADRPAVDVEQHPIYSAHLRLQKPHYQWLWDRRLRVS